MKSSAFLSILAFCIILPPKVLAGPPFETDDPFSLPYHTGEVYLFGAGSHTDAGTVWDAAPAIEANYSFIQNTFFHLVVPMSMNDSEGEPSAYGIGDIEIGFKWRVLDQSDKRPVVGVFPILELPSGNAKRGLGSDEAQIFLPVWLGKETGPWTVYGGGGYGIHPGKGNKNWWFTGILAQRQITNRLFLGGEIFHQTADAEEGRSSTAFSAGGGVTLGGSYQVLFSAGRNIQNVEDNRFSFYGALYRTF
jgi:hypothetical protein